jgi:Alw26I/Eco31I/Esp3I family type II restriction m6 adenine DNA methyltransferase
MNQAELQNLLNSPYNRENWINILRSVFNNKVQIFTSNNEIQVNNPKVRSFKLLGSVTFDDGKKLALLELKLNDDVNIVRNRVELNNLVSKYIDFQENYGVLSIFEQGGDDYRLTFSTKSVVYDAAKQDFVTRGTDSKRFTYLLGRNESCKTAAERLYKLSENTANINIQKVEEAFSVETLSKNFFKEYQTAFNLFVAYIKADSDIYDHIFQGDETAARNFVKVLFGRIVFIKFIQKKGWMGVPADSNSWADGNRQYIEDAFNNFPVQDNFHSKFLVPLFFDGLNRQRENDYFPLTGNKIPYLGGGLFFDEYPNTHQIDFPAENFRDFFEFLGKYNFTIDENDPNEQEIGVDPEMLGHIFENLLEDNKDKGAFYTPKEIVHYMCRESLKEYLKTYLTENRHWNGSEEDLDHALAELLNNKQLAEALIPYIKELATAMKNVKICDPAIGSGAFPMGLLNEIFHTVYTLYNANHAIEDIWGMHGWEPSKVKLNIIQNSIYGVDIEKGAVDIARLRFWLSLVVDEESPQALPSLDYKIVVGNSLVSKLGDRIIDIDWNIRKKVGSSTEHVNALNRNLKLLIEKQKAFFEHSDEALKEEIRNLKIQILLSQLNLNRTLYANANTIKADMGMGLTAKELKKNEEISAALAEYDRTISDLEELLDNPDEPLHFFDWKLDFPEVMNETITPNAGFDIVIGNPPYDVYEGKKKNEIEGLLAFNIYNKCMGGKINAYELFLAKADELLKKYGTNCQIFQNSFLSDNSSKGIRSYYLENQRIIYIDSFPERDDIKKRVFESAKMSVCVLMSKKAIFCDYKFSLRIHSDRTLNKYYIVEFNKSEIISFDPNNLVIPTLQKQDKGIFTKYYKSQNNEKYSEKFECLEGELNMTFHKDYMTNDITNPLIVKGAQIQRYFVTNNPSQGVIEYVDKESYLNDYSRSKKSLHHQEKRIALQGISGANDKVRLISTIIHENVFCANSCNYIIKKDGNTTISIYTLLGIFNSQLSNWIFRKTSTNSNVNCYEVNNLKIPIYLFRHNNTIEKLVKEILSLKSEGIETTALEQQIDNLVYRLYELSYDEVKIIDPDIEQKISRAEYEALEIE